MSFLNYQKLLGVGLFVATAGAIAGYHHLPQADVAAGAVTVDIPDTFVAPPVHNIEVVFAIDTTGSMGGLINAAKEKVWSIATTMAQAKPAPNIKIGLVAYRDRGDTYVTQTFDLTKDLDSIYAQLMDFKAQGGGDGPESVNQALHDALHTMSWSQGANAYRAVFLVGDAPGHTNYPNGPRYPELIRHATQAGIVVNTIRCGNDPIAAQQFQHIASLGQGRYFSVDQNGSALAFATPYDQRLANLSAQLDGTRLSYGDEIAQAAAELKSKATEKLHALGSVTAQARRAAFNASGSGAANAYGEQDLLNDLDTGAVRLEEVAEHELPKSLAKVKPAERPQAVQELKRQRADLKSEIEQLSGKRDRFLAEQAAKAPSAETSLDYQLFDAIKEQTKDKGLAYEGAPKL